MLRPSPAIRVRGHAENMDVAAAHLDHEEHMDAAQGHPAQSTWEKSNVGIAEACVRRNCRHVVRLRCGTGGSAAVRIRRSTLYAPFGAAQTPVISR
jgi:hypothetical protein